MQYRRCAHRQASCAVGFHLWILIHRHNSSLLLHSWLLIINNPNHPSHHHLRRHLPAQLLSVKKTNGWVLNICHFSTQSFPKALRSLAKTAIPKLLSHTLWCRFLPQKSWAFGRGRTHNRGWAQPSSTSTAASRRLRDKIRHALSPEGSNRRRSRPPWEGALLTARQEWRAHPLITRTRRA